MTLQTHIKFAIVVTVLFFVTITSAAEPIRVMTFNVRYASAADGENSWQHRRDFTLAVVRDSASDFIGMQEALIDPRNEINQVAFFTREMSEYSSLVRSREVTPERGETMLLLYRRDRWEVDPNDSGTFWLSDTPEVVGSKTWRGAGCPRIVTFGLFRELCDGQPTGVQLYVYNTHFDHLSDEARQRAAVLLLDRLNTRREPSVACVVMGDLNATEESATVCYLQGKPMPLDGAERMPPLTLRDTFRAVHPTTTEVGTFNGFRRAGTGKIDYILTTEGLVTRDAAIIRTQRDGRYPSDHFPVVATVTLGESKPE